ncbi:MAG: hypothetical protein ACFFFC_01995 [Candidatus Thorarchaeota archaeon]
MGKNWLAIAKTEFLVATSRFHRRRKTVSLLILAFALVWALLIAPAIMSSFVDLFAAEIQLILAVAFPGLMRSVMLLLWIIVLIYPISSALQEIRIGQWEIMLSNNVNTRDMLIGMFVGKLPSYGILVLILAPVLISPFAIVYQVTLIGQALMYGVLYITALATLWFSNVISTAIQAKLGESSRGNDIAKALSMVVAAIIIVPMYGIMYFAGPLAEVMGMDVFLILPSTWGADLVTWTAIYFNGIGLSQSTILAFESILHFGPAIDFLLMVAFSIFMLGIGFAASDRLFTIQAGARTEVVTTVGRDNLFLRGIKSVISGSFGVLVVTSLKDFGRKAQNLSRLGYGIFLSILLPFIMNFSGLGGVVGDPLFVPMMATLITGMMLSILGGVAFGGIGFLDSKDQLWILKGSPNGAFKFVRARVVSHILFAIPIALISTTAVTVILVLDVVVFLAMLVYVYSMLCGAILIATGITANNPAYEDVKSSAFMINTGLTVIIIMLSSIFTMIWGVIIMITERNIPMGLLVNTVPLLLVGAIVVFVGAKRLSIPEN